MQHLASLLAYFKRAVEDNDEQTLGLFLLTSVAGHGTGRLESLVAAEAEVRGRRALVRPRVNAPPHGLAEESFCVTLSPGLGKIYF